MKKLFSLFLLMSLYLGLHQEHLAVYSQNGNLKSILPYRAALYPKFDQQALKEGIPFSCPEELNRLLEDFLS